MHCSFMEDFRHKTVQLAQRNGGSDNQYIPITLFWVVGSGGKKLFWEFTYRFKDKHKWFNSVHCNTFKWRWTYSKNWHESEELLLRPKALETKSEKHWPWQKRVLTDSKEFQLWQEQTETHKGHLGISAQREQHSGCKRQIICNYYSALLPHKAM